LYLSIETSACLIYELACKTDDTIQHCAKAISLCKSRIESLKNSKDVLAGKDENASTAEGGSQKF
jgi:HAT1-interacting factor 1